MYLSLIIPCYQEALILKKHFDIIRLTLDEFRQPYEIILIDDASKDATPRIIEELVQQNPNTHAIYHRKNMGRGYCVKEGVHLAKGKISGFIDVDLEVHARYIPAVISALENGCDIATGLRNYRGEWHRVVLNETYSWMVKHYLGLNLQDTETGFKFWKTEKIKTIIDKIQSDHWFFDTEIMAVIYKKGLKVSEVPVVFKRNPDVKSTVHVVRDIWHYLKNLYLFKKRFSKL